jgi:methyl-accepting chemotaxis protein
VEILEIGSIIRLREIFMLSVLNRELNAKVAAISRSQAVIEFRLDGTIITANENFLRAMDYRLSDIVGRHHSMFVDSEYAKGGEYQTFWERLRRGEYLADKFRRLGRGGKEVWIQASYNPLLGISGRPFKIVKFATDITAVENERRANEVEREARAAEQVRVVQTVASGLRNIASGNLAASLAEAFAGEYEQLRTDFNLAAAKLRDTMKSVQGATSGISNGASEISQATDDLSRRTEQQAASLEETAAALEEITATVKKTAQNAKDASAIVTSAKGAAQEGGRVVESAIAAMSQIEQSSKQITDIIGVIDEIAFQTNLLALNAGVEAARAGDAGKGFAVVASEVRALAQRSSEAAREIKTLIKVSGEHVGAGVKHVGESGRALKRIVDQVVEINALVSEMALAAQQQSTGIEEVNTAVTQMDQVTQQNAAMVEQSTAAARNLAGDTAELSHLVSFFDVGETAARKVHPAPRPASKVTTSRTARPVTRTGAQRTAVALAARPRQEAETDDWQEF